jgi:hypothetical protein
MVGTEQPLRAFFNGRFTPTRGSGTGRSFKISTADGDIGRWSAIRWLADIERERPQRQPD